MLFIAWMGVSWLLAGCATEPKSCCARPASAPPIHPNGLPVLTVPAHWQTDAGTDFQLSRLTGQVVVISMFYSSCQGICTVTKDDLQQVEASLPLPLRAHTEFVLVSLAPELDTPRVLQQYRKDQGLAGDHWHLLRGSPAATAALAARLGIAYGPDASGLFRHASVLTVIGPEGQTRLQQAGIHADLTQTLAAIAQAAPVAGLPAVK